MRKWRRHLKLRDIDSSKSVCNLHGKFIFVAQKTSTDEFVCLFRRVYCTTVKVSWNSFSWDHRLRLGDEKKQISCEFTLQRLQGFVHHWYLLIYFDMFWYLSKLLTNGSGYQSKSCKDLCLSDTFDYKQLLNLLPAFMAISC